MTEQVSRERIFALAAAKLRQEFEELRIVPHKGVKGTAAEGIVKQFLNDHLPQRFRATSGFIIDHGDAITGHNDVIVYDALNCPMYRASDDASIIPNDNVAVVIEVKSRLNKDDLYNAAEKIRDAKVLMKSAPHRNDIATNTYSNYETLGILFAFDSDISAETALEHYRKATLKYGVPLHIDYVAVLDKFILNTMNHTGETWISSVLYALPPVEGLHLAVGAVKTGATTLDVLVRYLLAHLVPFRHHVDHPGFDWKLSEESRNVLVSYLLSVTMEPDPERRQEIGIRYREMVTNMMKRE